MPDTWLYIIFSFLIMTAFYPKGGWYSWKSTVAKWLKLFYSITETEATCKTLGFLIEIVVLCFTNLKYQV